MSSDSCAVRPTSQAHEILSMHFFVSLGWNPGRSMSTAPLAGPAVSVTQLQYKWSTRTLSGTFGADPIAGCGHLPSQEVYEVYGGLPPVFWDSLRLLSLQALMTPGLFRPQPTGRHRSQGSSITISGACELGQTGDTPSTMFPL